MKYYFPGPFIKNELVENNEVSVGFAVNSGKSAIRLALRSFKLPENSGVAIPAFCCNEVMNAVLDEKLKPVFFDMKGTGDYWTEYSEARLKSEEIKALIITHLYGFIHPDTEKILEICRRNEIHVIHDAAQSYGVNQKMFGSDPVVYSFGPGKSTTAARGGELMNVEKMATIPKNGFWNTLEAKIFYRSRLVGAPVSRLDVYLGKLSRKFMFPENRITELSSYQSELAKKAKTIALTKGSERKDRYNIVRTAIVNINTATIPYENEDGIFFKFVLYVKSDVDRFIQYLNENDIPFFRLADSIDMEQRDEKRNVNFKRSCQSLIELSVERSIPMSEIKRVAELLSRYKSEN
jgi:dTDP-4-amino-4,6-dideoxygalactose transaminase